MPQPAHIAVDLGAESGRVIVGTLNDGRLSMHEAHRFRHLPVPTPAGLCWDFTGLWRHILDGLAHAARHIEAKGAEAVSVGVDTWGVDSTLLNADGTLQGPPTLLPRPGLQRRLRTRDRPRAQTRDLRGHGHPAHGHQLALPVRKPRGRRARRLRRRRPPAVHARPLSTGCCAVKPWSNAPSPRPARWWTYAPAPGIVNCSNGWTCRPGPLTDPVKAGTPVGPLLPAVARETGLPASVQVVLPPGHDTASAIAAVPAADNTDWCYLSSGTWSLLGAELDAPVHHRRRRRGRVHQRTGRQRHGALPEKHRRTVAGARSSSPA